MNAGTQYPEHEKVKSLNGANQTVGEFIEWLRSEGYVLARWDEKDRLYPSTRSTTDLIAGFFNIDQKKLEAEKQQMLDSLRARSRVNRRPGTFSVDRPDKEAQ